MNEIQLILFSEHVYVQRSFCASRAINNTIIIMILTIYGAIRNRFHPVDTVHRYRPPHTGACTCQHSTGSRATTVHVIKPSSYERTAVVYSPNSPHMRHKHITNIPVSTSPRLSLFRSTEVSTRRSTLLFPVWWSVLGSSRPWFSSRSAPLARTLRLPHRH